MVENVLKRLFEGDERMRNKLIRVGTTYIPVRNVEDSLLWYVDKLGAVRSYMDEDKAIINLANQSFFLVRVDEGQTSNFMDMHGNKRFSITFEVDGMENLKDLHTELMEKNIKVGDIEDRGHPGRNFVFYDLDGNAFDVWSELSPHFKQKNLL